MRVIFMGGKQVGCEILKYLCTKAPDTEVVGVFVNPNDMDAGRWYPSASEIAVEGDVPVFMALNVNKPDWVGRLKGLAPQIIVVAYYNQILSREVFEIPQQCINVHLAKTERYRGCYPTTWALLNGDRETGVTIHHIIEEVDAGAVIAQRIVQIHNWDTGRSLYERCSAEAASLFKETWPLIIAGVAPHWRSFVPMPDLQIHHRPFPRWQIAFDGTPHQIANHIRAMTFAPFPPPYFMIGDTKYEVRPVE